MFLRVSRSQVWSSRHRMALHNADRGRLRFARAADRQTGGKGAEPPITPRQARRSAQREPPLVGGLRPLRPSRSPATASAGGVSMSHFAPQNGTHYKTPCGQWQKLTKHRNGRPHRAAKIAPGLCLGAIPYLAPLRRNRAAVRRAKYTGRRGKSPGGPYIFYGGEPTRGTPGPPRNSLI